jgi:hypothetical protein
VRKGAYLIETVERTETARIGTILTKVSLNSGDDRSRAHPVDPTQTLSEPLRWNVCEQKKTLEDVLKKSDVHGRCVACVASRSGSTSSGPSFDCRILNFSGRNGAKNNGRRRPCGDRVLVSWTEREAHACRKCSRKS